MLIIMSIEKLSSIPIHFVYRCCPVCDFDKAQMVFTDVNRREGLPIEASLVECRICGMQYLNPAPNAASLALLYTQGAVDPVGTDPIQVLPVSRTLPALSPIHSVLRTVNSWLRGHPHDWPEIEGQGRTILDFGCHDGSKLMFWYQRGWQVAGIDLNERAIEVARRRFPEGRFWCSDLLELEIAERFDFIRTDNVVEHLLNPVAYLTALAKLIKPGGALRVFVPNGRALSARLFGRYSYIYWVPFHLNLFSAKTLHLAMERAGFTEIDCMTFAPVGSWLQTQRQALSRPGFGRRRNSNRDWILQYLGIINYPGETLMQWLGVGDEIVATAKV
jgi:SAM-dependent methyltransferase